MNYIAVGSKNSVKTNAVRQGVFSFEKEVGSPIIYACQVDSSVRKQPLSDDECIQGAVHRARTAYEISNQKIGLQPVFSVGIEGGIAQTKGIWFERAWIAILYGDCGTEISLSSTISIELPNSLVCDALLFGKEIGDSCDERLGLENSKQKDGLFGILTGNRITRTSAYKDAVTAALSKIYCKNKL
jgi:inosine/xanthosine triphosphatase